MRKLLDVTTYLLCATVMVACGGGGGDTRFDLRTESAPAFEQEMLQQRSAAKLSTDAVAFASLDAGERPTE